MKVNLNMYTDKFNTICNLSEPTRTMKLSGLMDQLQSEFNIPMLNNPTFNEANEDVIKLYREISKARDL